MEHIYIEKIKYVDGDWNWGHTEESTLLQDEKPEIKDVRTTILADIMTEPSLQNNHVKEFLTKWFDAQHPNPTKEPAKLTLEMSKENKQRIAPEHWELYKPSVQCYWTNNIFTVVYDTGFDSDPENMELTYIISSIDDEKVLFFPYASWYKGAKYGDIQNRLFRTEPFSSFEEAQTYLDNINKKYADILGYHRLDIKIGTKTIFDTQWYKLQKAILDKTGELTDMFFEKFSEFTFKMLNNLYEDDEVTQLLRKCARPLELPENEPLPFDDIKDILKDFDYSSGY